MPRQAPYLLRWSPQAQSYEFFAAGAAFPHDLTPGGPGWLVWLDTINSFAFASQTGARCTVRKETIKRSGAYWYGYRFLQRRTVKRYIGRTVDLSIERLEEIAESFTNMSEMQGAAQEQLGVEAQADVQFSQEGSSKRFAPLLETRLHPPRLPPKVVERARLFARLDEWRSYKLTLLAAPAGFGKTTLVNSWLAKRRVLSKVGWVSLDASDNDPVRFWRAVLTVCQGTPDAYMFPLFLSVAQPSLAAFSLEDMLIKFLNTTARQGQHRLLILEDYHVISEPGIHETFSLFLSRLPEKLHVMLMTRAEPPIPLGRLRASGELNEIQTADLRFSLDESLTFLQQTLSAPPSMEVLGSLDTHLEGWVAGLRLLSLILQGSMSQSQIEDVLSTFRGSHRSIRDYFATEVLYAQSEQLQDFLLRTSVLPRLSASLCTAITGRQESALLLESSERANLFLEALDGTGEWYRYHALFAEAMQHEALRRLGEDELRLLSLRASGWFEEYGLLAEAIEAALKAGASERAATLIERYAESVRLPEYQEYHTLRRWLEQLPESVVMESPLLCLRYACALLFARDSQRLDTNMPGRIEGLLEMAEEGWRVRNNLARLGEVLAVRALLIYQQGKREQAVIWARQALAWLPETEPLWRGLSFITLGIEALQTGQFNAARQIFQEIRTLWQASGNVDVLNGMTLLTGMVCFEQGELHQAAWYFRELQKKSTVSGGLPVSLAAPLGLAQVFYEWNDLEMAKQMVEEIALMGEQATEIPQEMLQIMIELGLARLQQAEGKPDLAIQRLTNVLARLRTLPDGPALYFTQEATSWLVRLSLATGDYASAQYWLNDLPYQESGAMQLPTASDDLADAGAAPLESLLPASNATPVSRVFQEQRALLLVRVYLAQGEEGAALNILNELLPAAQAAGRKRNALQIKLLMAQAYGAVKQLAEARQVLLEGLKQGYAEGHQRIFLDEGERLYHLLRDLLPHLRGQPLRDYAQTLLQAFTQTPGSQPGFVNPVVSALFEPLSAQEQRVLRLLVAGLTNAEIARELVVSVNTIRSQVQSIYRKLQVNNRQGASEVARNLHLL